MHASLDPTVPVIADADTGYALRILIDESRKLIYSADSVDPPMSLALSPNTRALVSQRATLRTRSRRSAAAILWASRLSLARSFWPAFAQL